MFDVNGIEDFYDKNAVVTYEVNGHEIPVHLKQKFTPQTKVMFPEYSRDSPATGAAVGKSTPSTLPTSDADVKKPSSKFVGSKSALRPGDENLSGSKRAGQYEENHGEGDGSGAGTSRTKTENRTSSNEENGPSRHILPGLLDVLEKTMKKSSPKKEEKRNYKIENRSLMNSNYPEEQQQEIHFPGSVAAKEGGGVMSMNQMSAEDAPVLTQQPSQSKVSYYGNMLGLSNAQSAGQLASLGEIHGVEHGNEHAMREYDQPGTDRFDVNQMVNQMGPLKGQMNQLPINQFAGNREAAPNGMPITVERQTGNIPLRRMASASGSPSTADISWSDVGLDTTGDARSGSEDDDDKKKAKAKILGLLGLLADKLKGVSLDTPDKNREEKAAFSGNFNRVENQRGGSMINSFSSSKSNRCLNLAPAEYNHMPPVQSNYEGASANSYRASPDEERTVRTLQNTLKNMHRAIESDNGDSVMNGRTARDFLACVDSLPRVVSQNNDVSSFQNYGGNTMGSQRGSLLAGNAERMNSQPDQHFAGNTLGLHKGSNIAQTQENIGERIAQNEGNNMLQNAGDNNIQNSGDNMIPPSSRFHGFPHTDLTNELFRPHGMPEDLQSADEGNQLRHSSQFIVSGTRRGVQQSHSHRQQQPSIHSHDHPHDTNGRTNEDTQTAELKQHGSSDETHSKSAAEARKGGEEEAETYNRDVDQDASFASNRDKNGANRNLPQRDIEVDKEREKLIPETIQKFKDAGKPFVMDTDAIDYKPKDESEDGDDEKESENKMASETLKTESNLVSKFHSKLREGSSREEKSREEKSPETSDSKIEGNSDGEQRTHVTGHVTSKLTHAQREETEEDDENRETKTIDHGKDMDSTKKASRRHKYPYNEARKRGGSDDEDFVGHTRSKENEESSQGEKEEKTEDRESSYSEKMDNESRKHQSEEDEDRQGRDGNKQTEEKDDREIQSHRAASAEEEEPTSQSSKKMHNSKGDERGVQDGESYDRTRGYNDEQRESPRGGESRSHESSERGKDEEENKNKDEEGRSDKPKGRMEQETARDEKEQKSRQGKFQDSDEKNEEERAGRQNEDMKTVEHMKEEEGRPHRERG